MCQVRYINKEVIAAKRILNHFLMKKEHWTFNFESSCPLSLKIPLHEIWHNNTLYRWRRTAHFAFLFSRNVHQTNDPPDTFPHLPPEGRQAGRGLGGAGLLSSRIALRSFCDSLFEPDPILSCTPNCSRWLAPTFAAAAAAATVQHCSGSSKVSPAQSPTLHSRTPLLLHQGSQWSREVYFWWKTQ